MLKNAGQRGNLLLGQRRGQHNGEPDFKRAGFIVAQSRHHFRFVHGRDGARFAVEFVAAAVQMRQLEREPAQRVFQRHAMFHKQIIPFEDKHGVLRNVELDGYGVPCAVAFEAHLVSICNPGGNINQHHVGLFVVIVVMI